MRSVLATLAVLYSTNLLARGYSYGTPSGGFVILFYFIPIVLVLLFALHKNPIKTIFVCAIIFIAIGGTWFVIVRFGDDLGPLVIAPALLLFYGAFKLWDMIYPDDNKSPKVGQ
jgi:hypothetical protein